MKKVFRIWKMLERDLEGFNPTSNVKASIECLKLSWPFICEGKTKEECAELGFVSINNSWLVEEE